MTVPVVKPVFKQFFRIQAESAFGAGGGTADWNIGGNGGGAVGWIDLPVVPGSVRITPTETAIFTEVATGKRPMNQQAPIGGLYESPGSFEMTAFPELVDPILLGVMGAVNRVETAGTAAKSAVSFASLATLDTQSDGTEVLKFAIASSTAADAAAAINIIQNAVTVETIAIGANAGTVDGNYYSLGGYDGSVNAITFSIAGTVTSGMVTVSGVDFVTNTFTMADSNNSYRFEEAGQPRSGSDSSFYNGAALMDAVFSFDKTAADGMLMVTTNFTSQFPVTATPGTFGNHAALFYNPLAGWHATVTKDGAAFDKVTTSELTIHGGAQLFQVASGDQNPAGKSFGAQWLEGTLGVLPEDATEWNDFVGQTEADYTITFTDPQFIVDAVNRTVVFELTKTYLETYTEDIQQDNLFGASLGIRTIDDATDGIAKVTVVSRKAI